MVVVGKKFVIAKHFDGEPKPSDLTLVEFELPPVKDGEILVQAEYLSVDPYMRAYNPFLPVGATMIGGQVAKIIESKSPEFPVGKSIVCWNLGWSSHGVFNPTEESKELLNMKPHFVPDLGNLPISLSLGMLGMPGNTALYGFLEICKPKAGETVVVTGAAGAVGSHVGQLAKAHGLKVIGIAGSNGKCNWIVNDLGFDHAINYKTDDVGVTLKKFAPNGVDCYFDNVGGEISSIVISQMNNFGRVSVCGSISSYNSDMTKLPKATILQPSLVFKQLKVEGFIVSRFMDKWHEGIEKNLSLIKEGKLKYKETITEGFDNMFDAFIGMLKGINLGKAIVKA